MNDERTIKIAKYLLFSFFFVAILGAGFFYFSYQQEIKNLDNITKITTDDEFNKLFENENKDNEKENNENKDITKNNCYVDNVLVKNGEKVKLYSKRIINPYQDCNNFLKERICDNGFFLGDKSYRYIKCEKKLDCELPDGSIIKNNTEATLYSREKVPYNERGEVCERYAFTRKCKNSVLSGPKEYIYRQCKKSLENTCELPNGKIIANNKVFSAYKKNTVEWNQNCNTVENRKQFACANTQITGGDLLQYPYLSCIQKTPKKCYLSLNTPEGNKENFDFDHNERGIWLWSRGYGTSNHNCTYYRYQFDCINGDMIPSDGGEYSIKEYNYGRCYDN